jgi:MATE family multidrug resistance protein
MTSNLENPRTTIQEVRSTLGLASPIVASLLAQQSLGFIDTVMAGNLSAEDLAAVAIGRSVFIPIFIFVLGIVLAVNPIVAQYYGARKIERIGKTVWQGLLVSQMIAIPCVFLVRNLDVVLHFMNITPEIIPKSVGYLYAISWCLPAAFAYLTLRFFQEGISLARPNLYFTIIAIPVNILGNYLLMYGNLGFPRLGAVGAGWATTMVWWSMLTGMLIVSFRMKYLKQFKIFQGISWPDWHYIKEILRVGVPNGISIGMEVGMFAVAALLIGSLGVTMMAGHQIALNVASMTFMIPLGISFATTSKVGFAFGERDFHRVRLAGNVGNGISVMVMCCTATLMYLLPREIVSIYTNDMDVTPVAVQLLLMAAILQISDGLQASAAGALRGLKDTRIPMVVNLIAYWIIGIPFGYYLGITRQLGARGLWIGLIAGLTFAAISHTTRFLLHTRLERLRRLRD